MQFFLDDFEKVPADTGLFKMAANSMIERLTSTQDKILTSIMYQVLCEDTAMIGVTKQKIHATGETKSYTINFNRTK